MDPNQTFQELLGAIERGDADPAADLAKRLADWIENGGLVPQAMADAIEAGERREVSIDDQRGQW